MYELNISLANNVRHDVTGCWEQLQQVHVRLSSSNLARPSLQVHTRCTILTCLGKALTACAFIQASRQASAVL